MKCKESFYWFVVEVIKTMLKLIEHDNHKIKIK